MSMLSDDSDYDNYTETSDSDDQENESTYGGNAQSILSSLDESIGKIDDFLAYERGFLHGDVVCSINDQSGQLGRVINVDMRVNLETQFGELKKDVNSKVLQKLRPISCGDYVIQGPWLGRVDKVHDLVTILFNDGAICEILTGNSEIIIPISSRLFEDAPYPYFLGQRVKIKLPNFPKSVKWLRGASKMIQNEGTICKVEVGSVHVNWIASVITTSSSIPPHHIQNLKKLTALSCFSYANWQLGDWCILPVERYSPPNDKNCKHMYVISKTKSKVDVMWQNGNISVGLDAQTLFPVNSVGDHDFWPGQFVLEKVTLEDLEGLRGPPRLGIVKNVDVQDRTVKVNWKNNESESSEEMVSAYELTEHPDFSYCIGDIVFKALPNLSDDNSRVGDEKEHIYEGQSENSMIYLSYIGNVIGFKDEGVEVKWANGLTSNVHPSEIFGLDRLGDTISLPTPMEESVPEHTSKEIVEKARKGVIDKEKVVNVSTEVYENDVGGISSLIFPCSSIVFLKSIATSVFDFWKRTHEFQALKSDEAVVDGNDVELESLNDKVEEAGLKENLPFLSEDAKLEKFKQFDIVDDFSDHHFVNKAGKGLNSQVGRVWLKKVQQEWNILKRDLPDSIFVRVYEERIDLLRACIMGAPETPYHDGLFFFDIFFPPDYPNEPPAVHYNSGGLRLNPNLYENGKVCLSLLKTWSGTGTEVWDPQNSTILQVLLSLQALVLNDKPYFNEAGYDKQMGRAEGKKNSIIYNENAFVLSCKSMLYILHKPPKHFEELVSKHFACRSQHILLACKAYMDGAPMGRPLEPRNAPDTNVQDSCSTGFKIMLTKLFPKLVSGFEEKGIDCSQFH